MTTRTHRILAVLGLTLQLALPLGVFFGLLQLDRGFVAAKGDATQAANTFTKAVGQSLISLQLALGIGFVGLVLLGIPLFSKKVRAPWLLKWGRISMIPWLLLFPGGTIIGAIVLNYFHRYRAEFLSVKPADPLESQNTPEQN